MTIDTEAVAVAQASATRQAPEDASIRPFTVHVPEARLEDLRRRIAATQWPEKETVLDNVTLFWLTNTGVSTARLYWENKFPFFDFKNVTIPVAVSIFPGEFYQAPRSCAQRAYPKLVHYNQLDKGGHFPAWEQPTLFVEELRAGLRSLR